MCTLVYNEAPEAERTGFLFFKKMQSEKNSTIIQYEKIPEEFVGLIWIT